MGSGSDSLVFRFTVESMGKYFGCGVNFEEIRHKKPGNPGHRISMRLELEGIYFEENESVLESAFRNFEAVFSALIQHIETNCGVRLKCDAALLRRDKEPFDITKSIQASYERVRIAPSKGTESGEGIGL